jgi:hypothetical protein
MAILRGYTVRKNLCEPWVQSFLSGGWTPGTFGIRAIPAFVLVGMDGKIAAREMWGDDIKKEVARALSSPPRKGRPGFRPWTEAVIIFPIQARVSPMPTALSARRTGLTRSRSS